jgi:hypothetical protein
VLLLRSVLGLEPDPDGRELHVTADELPPWTNGLSLTGVQAFGRRWNVRVDDGGFATVGSE